MEACPSFPVIRSVNLRGRTAVTACLLVLVDDGIVNYALSICLSISIPVIAYVSRLFLRPIAQIQAGAKYGTGYCDAQCPHDLKFINGEANCEDWKPSSTDKNSGTGKYG